MSQAERTNQTDQLSQIDQKILSLGSNDLHKRKRSTRNQQDDIEDLHKQLKLNAEKDLNQMVITSQEPLINIQSCNSNFVNQPNDKVLNKLENLLKTSSIIIQKENQSPNLRNGGAFSHVKFNNDSNDTQLNHIIDESKSKELLDNNYQNSQDSMTSQGDVNSHSKQESEADSGENIEQINTDGDSEQEDNIDNQNKDDDKENDNESEDKNDGSGSESRVITRNQLFKKNLQKNKSPQGSTYLTFSKNIKSQNPWIEKFSPQDTSRIYSVLWNLQQLQNLRIDLVQSFDQQGPNKNMSPQQQQKFLEEEMRNIDEEELQLLTKQEKIMFQYYPWLKKAK